MSINIKFIIAFFIMSTLLVIKEIPYANIIVKDKIWLFATISYVIFALLFFPSNIWTKAKRINYLIIIFILTSLFLLIFTLIRVTILSEFFGTVLYGLFWVLVVYKILIYLKSPAEND